MARRFENPANGYVVTAGFGDVVLAVLFGPLYFAFTGLWAPAVAEVLIGIACLAALGPAGTVLIILIGIVVGCFAISIKSQRYLKAGWREVT